MRHARTMRTLATGGALAALAAAAWAAHPLITDDTGTQGRGRAALEAIGEYGHDRTDGVTVEHIDAPTVPFLSYGLADPLDLVLGLPYHWDRVEADGAAESVRGASDMSVELKARCFERNGWSLAVKPGISLPTGDEEKGLGNGRVSYSAFAIATRDAAPWAFHLNAGYRHQEYALQEDADASRRDLWHASLAAQVEALPALLVVANIGLERNADRASNTPPAFALGGLIYSVTDALDIDVGFKGGLNEPETDYALLAGIAWAIGGTP